MTDAKAAPVLHGPAMTASIRASKRLRAFVSHANQLLPGEEPQWACAGCHEGLVVLLRQPLTIGRLDLPPILERCCEEGQRLVATYAGAVNELAEALKSR